MVSFLKIIDIFEVHFALGHPDISGFCRYSHFGVGFRVFQRAG